MNEMMTVNDLADVLVRRYGLDPAAALDFVNAVFEICQEGLMRDRVMKIKDFGTFKIVDVDARVGVNVNTGERMLIDSRSKVTFVPDAIMKELVNKPFSQFETVVLNDGVDFSDLDKKGDVTEDEEEPSEEEKVSASASQNEVTDGSDDVSPSAKEAVDADSQVRQSVDEKPKTVVSEGEHEGSETQESPVSDEGLETTTEEEKIVNAPSRRITEALDAARAEMLDTSDGAEYERRGESVVSGPCDAAEGEPKVEEETTSTGGNDGGSAVDDAEKEKSETPDTPDTETLTAPSESQGQEEEQPEEHTSSRSPLWIHVASGVAVLALLAAAAYVGYLYGYHQAEETFMTHVPVKVSTGLKSRIPSGKTAQERADEPAVNATQIGTIQADRIAREDTFSKEVTVKVGSPTAAKPETMSAGKQSVSVTKNASAASIPGTASKVPSVSTSEDYTRYEKMDARVRTGAYRIVGQTKVVTAKSGQTLRQLSRTYLGDGMECYVEVFNGLSADTPLKEGMKVKIPKLVLKKKKMRQTAE